MVPFDKSAIELSALDFVELVSLLAERTAAAF